MLRVLYELFLHWKHTHPPSLFIAVSDEATWQQAGNRINAFTARIVTVVIIAYPAPCELQDLLNDPSVVERVLARTRETVPPVPVMDGSIFRRTMGHHCAIRTADIIRAMKFYSLLGLNEVILEC